MVAGASPPDLLSGMVTFHPDACGKCKARNPIRFTVTPAEAYRAVVLNRWRVICPSCFDVEAEKAGVRYSFSDLEGVSWSDRPVPSRGRRPKR
jgi:hypothetical protein